MRQAVAVSCFVLFFPVSVAAQAKPELPKSSELDTWIAHLKKCSSKTFSLKGEFDQDIRCDSSPEPRLFTGAFEVKRKGKYRWMYLEPKGKTMLSDGEVSYVYDKAAGTVIVGHPADSILSSTAQLLLGKVEDDIFIEHIGGANNPRLGPGVLQIIPASPHPFIRSILVTVTSEAPCIKRVIVVDSAGCIIRTTFKNVRRNTGVKERRFSFTPPKNAVIITP